MDIQFPESWKKLLAPEFEKEYFKTLTSRVRNEYLSGPVYPHPKNIFRAFAMMTPHDVRVVILGQDPYHTPGVADGLAFSTLSDNRIPPSLLNMFKEIETEFGYTCNKNPNLERWAIQGVLLLNASLSVRAGSANSHAEYGWHEFTDAVIRVISQTQEHVVFILWGSFARKKSVLINGSKHLILESPHPSPLSAHNGFFGNGHFKKTNEYLVAHGKPAIDWR
ncbi:MAG: uracil-DNA glycosylase [Patescibacteria group bacterium]